MAVTVLALVALVALVVQDLSGHKRVELEFANANDYLVGYEWEPPYEGAGPETPEWAVTPGSVGQGAVDANDPTHQESNVIGGDYEYPDYAHRSRFTGLAQVPLNRFAVPTQNPRHPQLWVGSPQKFLPPDGDYPGGQTGIPLDGYLAYETGWANDGPFHGELAPMQEAGIASKSVRPTVLSIMDPGFEPAIYNDWALGNQRARTDKTYDPDLWENEDQPLDQADLGMITCEMGADCHDGTHQGGVHYNGNEFFENYHTGTLNPSSDRSVTAEY